MESTSIRPTSIADESMLAGVQQHPDPSGGRPGENAREYAAATHAREVLFHGHVFRSAGAIERQVAVRLDGGGLAIKISARRARLNPEIHSRSRLSRQPVFGELLRVRDRLFPGRKYIQPAKGDFRVEADLRKHSLGDERAVRNPTRCAVDRVAAVQKNRIHLKESFHLKRGS
jgi:hypothetical protein